MQQNYTRRYLFLRGGVQADSELFSSSTPKGSLVAERGGAFHRLPLSFFSTDIAGRPPDLFFGRL